MLLRFLFLFLFVYFVGIREKFFVGLERFYFDFLMVVNCLFNYSFYKFGVFFLIYLSFFMFFFYLFLIFGNGFLFNFVLVNL